MSGGIIEVSTYVKGARPNINQGTWIEVSKFESIWEELNMSSPRGSFSLTNLTK